MGLLILLSGQEKSRIYEYFRVAHARRNATHANLRHNWGDPNLAPHKCWRILIWRYNSGTQRIRADAPLRVGRGYYLVGGATTTSSVPFNRGILNLLSLYPYP